MKMKINRSLVAWSFLLTAAGLHAEPFTQAEVTRKVNIVSLLEKESAGKPARIGDIIRSQTAVKTGTDSRAELQFPDATVMRLGANAFFSFQSGTRSMDLEGGAMLFSSPKGQGGGQVQAGAVTAAVSGTNFLLSRFPNGDVKLIVLEGKVWLSLARKPEVRRLFRAGQLVLVKADAEEIPEGTLIDLDQILATSRLLEAGGFGPLPDQILLREVAKKQRGRIIQLPDSLTRDQQAAQTARRAGGPPDPRPRPVSNNRPAPFVAPTPPPPPPTPPPPTPCPTRTPTRD